MQSDYLSNVSVSCYSPPNLCRPSNMKPLDPNELLGKQGHTEQTVLAHISALCNNVTQKSSASALHRLRTKKPSVFSNPLLFRETLKLLNTYQFKLAAKRFVLFQLFDQVIYKNDGDSDSDELPIDLFNASLNEPIVTFHKIREWRYNHKQMMIEKKQKKHQQRLQRKKQKQKQEQKQQQKSTEPPSETQTQPPSKTESNGVAIERNDGFQEEEEHKKEAQDVSTSRLRNRAYSGDDPHNFKPLPPATNQPKFGQTDSAKKSNKYPFYNAAAANRTDRSQTHTVSAAADQANGHQLDTRFRAQTGHKKPPPRQWPPQQPNAMEMDISGSSLDNEEPRRLSAVQQLAQKFDSNFKPKPMRVPPPQNLKNRGISVGYDDDLADSPTKQVLGPNPLQPDQSNVYD